MIYLDNAASSWPKPASVARSMADLIRENGANPGRSAHRLSIAAARILYDAREKIATLFNLSDPLRVIYMLNATEALNTALYGILEAGDRVLTSGMEHNSTMRPLRELERRGVEIEMLPSGADGFVDPDTVRRAVLKRTKIIAINHGSNVTGIVQPIREIGKIARDCGALFLVDAAQTAGCIDIDIKRDCIDLLAFSGHKALLGPQGTGGLVISPDMDENLIKPLKRGGTGSRSEYESQPDFLPDKFESGTPNTVGIAGLREGISFVLHEGIQNIRGHEQMLLRRLFELLEKVRGIVLFCSTDMSSRMATLSFNVEGLRPDEIGERLDSEYEIMSRVGLHCSPAAHQTIGSFPEGTVRFSLGYFNTVEEVECAADALDDIQRSAGK